MRQAWLMLSEDRREYSGRGRGEHGARGRCEPAVARALRERADGAASSPPPLSPLFLARVNQSKTWKSHSGVSESANVADGARVHRVGGLEEGVRRP